MWTHAFECSSASCQRVRISLFFAEYAEFEIKCYLDDVEIRGKCWRCILLFRGAHTFYSCIVCFCEWERKFTSEPQLSVHRENVYFPFFGILFLFFVALSLFYVISFALTNNVGLECWCYCCLLVHCLCARVTDAFSKIPRTDNAIRLDNSYPLF